MIVSTTGGMNSVGRHACDPVSVQRNIPYTEQSAAPSSIPGRLPSFSPLLLACPEQVVTAQEKERLVGYEIVLLREPLPVPSAGRCSICASSFLDVNDALARSQSWLKFAIRRYNTPAQRAS